MNSYYVKLVGQYYKLNCVVKQVESGIYITQYGGVYAYVEKDGKKYFVSEDDWLEITHIEKLQGAIIL